MGQEKSSLTQPKRQQVQKIFSNKLLGQFWAKQKLGQFLEFDQFLSHKISLAIGHFSAGPELCGLKIGYMPTVAKACFEVSWSLNKF